MAKGRTMVELCAIIKFWQPSAHRYRMNHTALGPFEAVITTESTCDRRMIPFLARSQSIGNATGEKELDERKGKKRGEQPYFILIIQHNMLCQLK